MSNNGLGEIVLPLDERNLAHVLSAVAFAGLALRFNTGRSAESLCWWDRRGFALRTDLSLAELFDFADTFLRKIIWIPGLGTVSGVVSGTFATQDEVGSNPFISLAELGQEKSPFKTFAGQQDPGRGFLTRQQNALDPPRLDCSWIEQSSLGIASWGFDSRVGSHAYDLGFSSNDEGSGHLDPVYPAIELLSIAGASFFSAIQGWQLDGNAIEYSIWHQPLSLLLASYAASGRLDGLQAQRYRATSRGGTYGKGAAYRFFPEAGPID